MEMESSTSDMASGGDTERAKPNVLISGTPGTGKSITASEVCLKVGLQHVDVGALAKEHNLYEGWDEQYQCPILDEDKVVDELEESMSAGGNIVEYHGCDFFPERWFDAIFVLRTDNTILYDRLKKRGYGGKKLSDNVQCEIFQTILEEAKESFSDKIVYELHSNLPEDLERNVDTISHFVQKWTPAKS